jgi:hypothetical protein
MSKLLDHFKQMQLMVKAYLTPGTPYTNRELVEHHDPLDADKAFIGDMIYMLDGPEQRAAQAEVGNPVHHPADTGTHVASLAGKYASFSFQDLLKLSTNDETSCLEAFCADVRSMAASLLRQNEQ